MPREDSPTIREYLDFELEIGGGNGQPYTVRVLNSPAGEALETVRLPFDEPALERQLLKVENAILRSGGKRRQTVSTEEQPVREFGRSLFDALFVGKVGSRYELSLDKARQEYKGLRLKLRVQPPELAYLPWEIMFDERTGDYITLSNDTPLVRYIEMQQTRSPLAVTPPLRILGMIASPQDQEPLDTEDEKRQVEKGLGNLVADGSVRLTWLPGQTWDHLQRAMRTGTWNVFHFVGHGGFDKNQDEGFIVLADDEKNTFRMSATNLARLLASHFSLRLVLLNSCEGATGGRHDVFSSTASILVRRGIPAVLAMQYAISDSAAIQFSRTFYKALADAVPVDQATAEARIAISIAYGSSAEWATPVLYMRTRDGVLFNIKVTAPEESERQERELREKEEREQAAARLESGRLEAERLAREKANQERIAREKSEGFGLSPKISEAATPAPLDRPRPLPPSAPKVLPNMWFVGGVGAIFVIGIVLLGLFGLANVLGRILTPSVAATTPLPSLTPSSEAIQIAQASPTLAPTISLPSPTPVAPILPIAAVPIAGEERMIGGAPMMFVPAGDFLMGSSDADKQAKSDEKPQHTVYLDAFWMDKFLVTGALYNQCVNASKCRPQQKNSAAIDNYPVDFVSWDDASAFCVWAGKRLPTEAEWEKAARGTDGRIYPWGNTFDKNLLNWSGSLKGEDTAVGSYPAGASPYGVLDMAGNVWEYVADWYDANYYANSPRSNPTGPSSSAEVLHVTRGGSWLEDQSSVRSSKRSGCAATNGGRCVLTGFRCARSFP